MPDNVIDFKAIRESMARVKKQCDGVVRRSTLPGSPGATIAPPKPKPAMGPLAEEMHGAVDSIIACARQARQEAATGKPFAAAESIEKVLRSLEEFQRGVAGIGV